MCENISYSQCLLYVSWLSSYVWTVISYIVDYIFTSYKLRKYIQIVIQNWDWHCKIHKNILFFSSISFWIISALDFPIFFSTNLSFDDWFFSNAAKTDYCAGNQKPLVRFSKNSYNCMLDKFSQWILIVFVGAFLFSCTSVFKKMFKKR